jgi:hypothetical protein
LANAMPAIVAALCIFSRATGSLAPSWYERGRYSKMSLIACSDRPARSGVCRGGWGVDRQARARVSACGGWGACHACHACQPAERERLPHTSSRTPAAARQQPRERTLGVVGRAHRHVALQRVHERVEAAVRRQAARHAVHEVGVADGHVGRLRLRLRVWCVVCVCVWTSLHVYTRARTDARLGSGSRRIPPSPSQHTHTHARTHTHTHTHTRAHQCVVGERVLDARLLVRDDGERRDLAARARRGRDGHKLRLLAQRRDGVDALADVLRCVVRARACVCVCVCFWGGGAAACVPRSACVLCSACVSGSACGRQRHATLPKG